MKFRVEYMNREAYNTYMMGGYVIANTVDVEAPTAELAVTIAQALIPGDMVFNGNYVKAVEEIEKEEEARRNRIETEKRKAQEKKEWEAAHPEIVAERKRKAKITRYKREIREAQEEIERLQKLIERKEKALKEIEG